MIRINGPVPIGWALSVMLGLVCHSTGSGNCSGYMTIVDVCCH